MEGSEGGGSNHEGSPRGARKILVLTTSLIYTSLLAVNCSFQTSFGRVARAENIVSR